MHFYSWILQKHEEKNLVETEERNSKKEIKLNKKKESLLYH